MQAIVSNLGGEWTEFERDWRIVNAAVSDLKTAPSVSAVKEQLQDMLESLTGDPLTPDQAKQINSVARTESGWKRLEATGLAGLPQGQPAEAGRRLLSALEVIGLRIVPIGELERWAPTIADHGPQWVSTALEQHVHEAPGPHADFAQRLVIGTGAT